MLGESHGGFGVVGLDFKMEEEAAVEREEEIDDEQNAKAEAGGADGGGNHEEEIQYEQLCVVAVVFLDPETGDLLDDQKLADDEDGGAFVCGEVVVAGGKGVGDSEEENEIDEDGWGGFELVGFDEPGVDENQGHGDDPKARGFEGEGEPADAEEDQDVENRLELLDVVHGG